MVHRVRQGFTIVELLVVLAIIGILVGLLIPGVHRLRASAARTQCMQHLKQLGAALHHYHQARKCFPPALVSNQPNLTDADTTGFALLLPYLDGDTVSKSYKYDES